MVKGIESFREWFKGYEDHYVIIGGSACSVLMEEEGLSFRATKDLDVVLIVEALDADFGKRFWEYVKMAGYEHCNKSSLTPEFYRFSHPSLSQFPAMIELFSRKKDGIKLPAEARLTPLPLGESISSLSAILLDDAYYDFLKQGKVLTSGVSLLDEAHLIPFKMKAWLDLSRRKKKGEQVDSKDIRKHKNDVFRLAQLLRPSIHVPASKIVYDDIQDFLLQMKGEDVDLKQLGLGRKTKEDLLNQIKEIYVLL